MRHRTAFASVVICLLASLGLSSQALAVTNSDCDGSPYTDEFALHEFFMDSPLSHKAGEVSSIVHEALACGSDLTDTGGDETLIDHVTITNPPGAGTTNTGTVPVGSFVGYAYFDVLGRADGEAGELNNISSSMFVDDLSVCESESQKLVGGPTPGRIIACYKSVNDYDDKSWSWVALNGGPTYTFTVGPMYALGIYLTVAPTRMKVRFCPEFGAIDGRSCNTSGVNIQRNGQASASFPKLECNANGSYSATATRRDGQVTQSVSSCVPWVDEWGWGVYPRLRPRWPLHDLPSPGRSLPKQPRPRWPLHDNVG